MTRVCILEEDRNAREGFFNLLNRSDSVACIGAYSNVEEAEQLIAKHLPDVLLMNLQGRQRVEGVAKLKRRHPQVIILILTNSEEEEEVHHSLRAGAHGYLLKRALEDELLHAITKLHRSSSASKTAREAGSHVCEGSGRSDLELLTKREKEILQVLATGLPYKNIADNLGISISTVHAHLHAIYGKLRVQNRTEAVVKFLER